MRYCKHPCYDCPFRRDILPYMDQAALDNNLALFNDGRLALCHHTCAEGRSNCAIGSVPQQHLCGGWLAVLGERECRRRDLPVVHSSVTFRSIDDLRRNGLAWLDPQFAYYLAQPPSKRERLVMSYYAQTMIRRLLHVNL